jgi:hypothetical protein
MRPWFKCQYHKKIKKEPGEEEATRVEHEKET